MPTVHLFIKGKVQGVFFRATAKNVADKMGIKGWIKNTKEGHVEIVAGGSEQQVLNFIDWCKMGPPRAVVTDVVITNTEEKSLDSFCIIRH